MDKHKETVRKKLNVKASIDRELTEIKKILDSTEDDDVQYRSIRAILIELSNEIVAAKVNSMFESRTGLLSAKYGEEMLKNEIVVSKRSGNCFSLALIDIDFLKYINDNYGHVVGTKVIISVAEILKASVRKYDILCRYGGDEFLIIFPGINGSKAEKIVKRIKNMIGKEKFEKGARVTLSYGVVDYCGKGSATSNSMMKRVDKELYKSKKHRTNINLK